MSIENCFVQYEWLLVSDYCSNLKGKLTIDYS